MPMDRDELQDLERRGWQALATSGDAAVAFYGEALDADAVMLLPGGLRLTGREAIVEAMQHSPWTGFELDDVTVLELGADVGLVAYRATARRPEGEYHALFSSVWVRRAEAWRLAFHQQTPV
jgi:hypothetical protein